MQRFAFLAQFLHSWSGTRKKPSKTAAFRRFPRMQHFAFLEKGHGYQAVYLRVLPHHRPLDSIPSYDLKSRHLKS